jgi:glucose 1-dehydrogenase
MNRFNNKVVVITGAAAGIGFEIARQLCMEGASVVINDIHNDNLELASKKIEAETNGRISCFPGDAGDVSFVYKLVDFTVATYGKIDSAVANAGITLFEKFLDFTEDSFQKIVDLNLKGSFFLTQAFARQLKMQGTKGSVVLMSSNIGFQAYPDLSAYAVTKSGIKMMARNLVTELSPLGIRINAVAPGATLTERTALEKNDYWQTWSAVTPLQQIATVSDIAKTSLFLLSDDASHITGQTLVVDGGWEAVSVQPRYNTLPYERE